MNKSELIEKIKKLLALSDSSNPNEAAIALSRAQKLMEKYKIEAAELNLGNDIGEIMLKPLSALTTQTSMNLLLSIIKKAFGIESILHTRNSKIQTVSLIGPTDLLECCEYIFTVLSRQAAAAIGNYSSTIECEVLLETFQNPRLLLAIEQHVPIFYRIAIEPFFCFLQVISEELNLTETKIDYNYLKGISKRFKDARNEAYKNLPEWRVTELKRLFSSKVKEKKNAFILGYFKSIEKKIEEYALTEKTENSITAYISHKYPALTQSRKHYMSSSKAAIEAYQKGVNEGSKVTLNSAIKDRAPRIPEVEMKI
jgi:hypothetical protein